MALTWDQTKALMRLKAVAEELVLAARRVSDSADVLGVRRAHVGTNVDALIVQIRVVLKDSPDLAVEFDAVLRGTSAEPIGTEPKAVVVSGWLRGVVDAEAFEMRVREEAKAYAEARVHRERPIGFAAPPDPAE